MNESNRERAKLNKSTIYKQPTYTLCVRRLNYVANETPAEGRQPKIGKPRSSINRHKMNWRIKSNDLLVNVNEIYFSVLHLVDSMHWLISFGFHRKTKENGKNFLWLTTRMLHILCLQLCLCLCINEHALAHSLACSRSHIKA